MLGSGRGASLFWRLFWVNAAILTLAGLILILSPATVSDPIAPGEAAVIAIGVSLMLVLNVLLTRRVVEPLIDLREAMAEVDPLRRTTRLRRAGGGAEVRALTASFNEMLDRLESERRRSTRRALAAQEGERGRIARELHDEIGQSLTVLLLQIDGLSGQAPEPLRAELAELREAVRATMDDVRRIVRELRPDALDDLGLAAALSALADRFEDHGDLRVDRRLELPRDSLPHEQELVVYRVAQEALTNVVRHAGATRATLELRRDPDGVVLLRVTDDGAGIGATEHGSGLHGMRERAVAVGARVQVRDAEAGGTEVVLRMEGDG